MSEGRADMQLSARQARARNRDLNKTANEQRHEAQKRKRRRSPSQEPVADDQLQEQPVLSPPPPHPANDEPRQQQQQQPSFPVPAHSGEVESQHPPPASPTAAPVFINEAQQEQPARSPVNNPSSRHGSLPAGHVSPILIDSDDDRDDNAQPGDPARQVNIEADEESAEEPAVHMELEDPDDVDNPFHPEFIPMYRRPARIIFRTQQILANAAEIVDHDEPLLAAYEYVRCHELGHLSQPELLQELLARQHRTELDSIVYRAEYNVSENIDSVKKDRLPPLTNGLNFLPTPRDKNRVLGILISLRGTSEPSLMALTHLCMALAKHPTLHRFKIISMVELSRKQEAMTDVMSSRPLGPPKPQEPGGEIEQYIAFDDIDEEDLVDMAEPAPAITSAQVVTIYTELVLALREAADITTAHQAARK